MSVPLWLAASTPTVLGTSAISMRLGAQELVENSTDLPARCHLYSLTVLLSEITGGGSTQVSAWLTYDETGSDGITPQRTTSAIQTYTPDLDVSTNGYVSWRIETPFLGADGECWAHVVLDAGTATGVVKLIAGPTP